MLIVRPVEENKKLADNSETEKPRNLEEELEIARKADPNAYFFAFRGLAVRKFQQKFTVLTPEYNFVQNESAIGFLEKFAAIKFEEVARDIAINKKDIPINVPRDYKR